MFWKKKPEVTETVPDKSKRTRLERLGVLFNNATISNAIGVFLGLPIGIISTIAIQNIEPPSPKISVSCKKTNDFKTSQIAWTTESGPKFLPGYISIYSLTLENERRRQTPKLEIKVEYKNRDSSGPIPQHLAISQNKFDSDAFPERVRVDRGNLLYVFFGSMAPTEKTALTFLVKNQDVAVNAFEVKIIESDLVGIQEFQEARPGTGAPIVRDRC